MPEMRELYAKMFLIIAMQRYLMDINLDEGNKAAQKLLCRIFTPVQSDKKTEANESLVSHVFTWIRGSSRHEQQKQA